VKVMETIAEEDREIGRRVREARGYLMMSQEQLARALSRSLGKTTQNSISRIERGEQHITARELAALCRLRGISVDAFLAGVYPGGDSTEAGLVIAAGRAA